MERLKYVILRAPSIHMPEFGMAALAVGPSGVGAEAIGELEVATAELDSREAGELRRDPAVLSFAPVMELKLHEPLVDEEESNEQEVTWGVEAVAADTSPFVGSGVTVAVLDTGIDSGHEAFQGTTIIEKDFTGEGNGDPHGHGTHCAGTVFGKSVGGLRIGVAPGVDRALIGKVLSSRGRGSTEEIVQAVQWALSEGANVISMSLGIDFPGVVDRIEAGGVPRKAAVSMGLEAYRANINVFGRLAAFARSRGSIFQASIIVAATGNESDRPNFEVAVAPPAAADDIFAVGAVGPSPNGLTVARFSNTKADICAPGVGIRSAATGGGIRSLSGTSMATPHVAGVAALWAAKLLQTSGRIDTTALAARLIGSGSYAPLAGGFNAGDVGTGVVQAPQP